MPFSPSNRFLWAIDTSADKAAQMHTVGFLEALTRNHPVSIEPITVLSPDQLQIPAKAFEFQKNEHLLEAEQTMKEWLGTVKLKGLKEPKLLASESFSRADSAKTLVKYAEATNAALIVMNSHTKKGLMRFLLGSFAENLVLRSKTPLFIVNPNSKPASTIDEVLFPTDLSEDSKGVFNKVIDFAKGNGAKVVLYHKVEYMLPETYLALTTTRQYVSYMNEEADRRTKLLDQWAKIAEEKGVKTETLFDKEPAFLVDAILKRAERMKSGVIAMQSSVSPTEALMIGSTTRQVIRNANCPVWVMHHFKK